MSRRLLAVVDDVVAAQIYIEVRRRGVQDSNTHIRIFSAAGVSAGKYVADVAVGVRGHDGELCRQLVLHEGTVDSRLCGPGVESAVVNFAPQTHLRETR